MTGSDPSGVTASPGSRQTAALQEDTNLRKPHGVFNLELFYYCSTMGFFLVIMKNEVNCSWKKQTILPVVFRE